MFVRGRRPSGQKSEKFEFQHLGAPLILLSRIYDHKILNEYDYGCNPTRIEKKLQYFTLVEIGTKLGQNVYDHKILDQFNYASNWTRTTGVICP